MHALAADLRAAGYTVDALAALWGAEAGAALERGQRVPALRALDDSPPALLARAFVLGIRTDLATALPTLGVDGAVALGLIRPDGSPLLDLRPYAFVDGRGIVNWWIASDLGEVALGGPIPEDHVLGVGGASTTLTGLLIARPVERALDLGTGCGIQAMHIARHARHVVATDVSERALRLAAFNCALNGIDTVEFRLGSLFEPVAGERFGHIVSNPPFVITPRRPGVPAYEYRDGGMVGDELVQTVVRGLHEHLEPGGVAQLLGNWEYTRRDGLARVQEWTDGLDAWVIERDRQDAARYAETWIRDGGTRPGPGFDALVGAWLDDFDARGVHEVGFGYLTLRRPVDAPALRRFERLQTPVAGALGESIERSLSATDPAAELRDARLTVAPDVTEERHYWPGAEHPTVLQLRQGSGFARVVPIGTALAAVVGACDGDLPVAAICAAVAELLEVDPAQLEAEVLPQLHELLFCGLLLRA